MGKEKATVPHPREQAIVGFGAQQVEQADMLTSDRQHVVAIPSYADYDVHDLYRGQIVQGVIVQISPSEILVDVGAKSEGVIGARELEWLGADGLAALHEGQSVFVYVVDSEDRNGNPVLSLSRAQVEQHWQEAERLFESGEIFEGIVAAHNKGGLIVYIGQVRGFVPSSQIISRQGDRYGPGKEDWLAGLVGTRMQLKVIEVDRDQNRLIFSERAAMQKGRRQNKKRLLAELKEGAVCKGTVVNIRDFGVFVDLGGADGLIHISELSWRRPTHPTDVVKVGDEIKVYVLSVDRERQRIGLSLKRLQPDPWDAIADRYHVGQLVKGTIIKVLEFGAFVRISDGIDGLVHLSELSEENISHPGEAVQEGDQRMLRIVRIDPDQRRIGLSLKRVNLSECVDVDAR